MSDHSIKTPLLPNNQTQSPNQETQQQERTHLHKTLERFKLYLTLLGYDQSSILRFGVSWVTFLVIGVAFPVAILSLHANCSTYCLYEIEGFELVIIVSHACLAAVALLCLSHNLWKYGVRGFLFVDQCSGHVERFSKEYWRNTKRPRQITDNLRVK